VVELSLSLADVEQQEWVETSDLHPTKGKSTQTCKVERRIGRYDKKVESGCTAGIADLRAKGESRKKPMSQ
jgi:hypothetical protein